MEKMNMRFVGRTRWEADWLAVEKDEHVLDTSTVDLILQHHEKYRFRGDKPQTKN
jgi:hypothetical protein